MIKRKRGLYVACRDGPVALVPDVMVLSGRPVALSLLVLLFSPALWPGAQPSRRVLRRATPSCLARLLQRGSTAR